MMFFLETPFLIKEQKVLKFKVKVDIIVPLQKKIWSKNFLLTKLLIFVSINHTLICD